MNFANYLQQVNLKQRYICKLKIMVGIMEKIKTSVRTYDYNLIKWKDISSS